MVVELLQVTKTPPSLVPRRFVVTAFRVGVRSLVHCLNAVSEVKKSRKDGGFPSGNLERLDCRTRYGIEASQRSAKGVCS